MGDNQTNKCDSLSCSTTPRTGQESPGAMKVSADPAEGEHQGPECSHNRTVKGQRSSCSPNSTRLANRQTSSSVKTNTGPYTFLSSTVFAKGDVPQFSPRLTLSKVTERCVTWWESFTSLIGCCRILGVLGCYWTEMSIPELGTGGHSGSNPLYPV